MPPSKEQEEIVIVGAGICGLCTALALAANNFKVTLYERDGPPPHGDADHAFFEWQRRGAAQFRHPHAFLALMCSILEENYPDLVEDFWQAGARKISFEQMLTPVLLEQYHPQPDDNKMWLLMCRRATMETVLRRYVERQGNIEINNAATVTGILAEVENDSLKIKGIKLRDQDPVLADIVIDACGRTSKFNQWFAEAGVIPEVESHDAQLVYYTRHYQLLPGIEEPERSGKDRSAGDLGYIKYGVFPGEQGHFAVILCLPNCESELRTAIKDGEQFDLMCRSIPGLVPWVSDDVSVATTASFGFGDIQAVWRHFVKDDKPLVTNFFAVGDAHVRTNPLYGRGCSIGILHAHLLANMLSNNKDPYRRALEFDRLTEDEIRPIYRASLNDDIKGIERAEAIHQGKQLAQAKTLKQKFRLAIGDAVSAAASENIHVMRGAMRTFNLLEKPGEFMKDRRIQLTVFRYLFRGRKVNAASRMQRGPSRLEMLAIVTENQQSSAA